MTLLPAQTTVLTNPNNTNARLNTSIGRTLGLIVLAALLVLPNTSLSAAIFTTETLSVENRSPVILNYALSRPTYTQPGKQQSTTWRSRFEIANYLSTTQKGGEYYFIDGETWIITNSLQHWLSDTASIQIAAPWIKHSKGFSDRFIYNFHNVFQLPQNGRTDSHHDLINWVLRNDGQNAVSLSDDVTGWGDVTIDMSYQNPESNIRWQSRVKLPTGDFDKQTGSGRADVGLSGLQLNPAWLRNRSWLAKQPISVWYGMGLNYLSHIEELETFDQYNWVVSARAGIAWAVSDHWTLKSQLDSNSPFFKSEIRELGWAPLQLSLATEHKFTENTAFDFILIEDLRPRATADVIFSLGIQHRF